MKINFKKLKLSKEEREIEKAIERNEFVPISRERFKEISEAIAHSLQHRKKDTVLNIRINLVDLDNLKRKAKRYGVRYQTFISEILHHHAA